MANFVLPQTIEEIFELADIDRILSALMVKIVEILSSDRCFLYTRDPHTRLGKAAFCYCGNPDIPNVTSSKWSRESPTLEERDPMFAAALQCQPHIFVEDVETAPVNTLNREFEREHFGHRALIHAHLCHEGKLWGVLQPSVFSKPRHWSDRDRQIIEQVAARTTPLVIKYVNKELK